MSADSQAIAHEVRVPEFLARRLQPLYYLHNFRRALRALQERYGGLLSADEAGFIAQFDCLSEAAQCLLTRLAMRKGPLFRRATLQYVEVPDLEKALQALAACGWIDPDPLLSAEQLFRVLNPAELRLAVGTARGRRSRQDRPDLLATQLALPLHDQPAVHRSLADWNVRLTGGVVRALHRSIDQASSAAVLRQSSPDVGGVRAHGSWRIPLRKCCRRRRRPGHSTAARRLFTSIA